MCGVVGYVGNKKAKSILIEGLSKLEYRGYDSAGMSLVTSSEIKTLKNVGRVNDLLNLVNIESFDSECGIAHTRWATHGKPSSTNAHPHNDSSNTFSVVHNGIIENYEEIRNRLIEKKYKFLSETDTEVIPNLIHYYFSMMDPSVESFLKAVNMACNEFQGSFAIGVVSTYFPNTIIACKKESPLVIGKGIDENFISSDVTAFLSYTQDFYYPNNYEYAVITDKSIEFYNNNLDKINKEATTLNLSADCIEKKGYDDFMLKEIYDQPTAIRETLNPHLSADLKCTFDELKFSKEYLKSLNNVYIVACGTAMHAGLAGRVMMENLLEIPVFVDIASEFRYRNPIINEHSLCIFISQSGETADTLAALKLAKSKKSKTIAITNVKESSITREADYTLYTYAGPEIAVASTKAYTAQITLVSLLTIYMTEKLEKNPQEIKNIKESLLEIPTKIEALLSDISNVKEIAKKYYNNKESFFIGRNLDYITAAEGALKLKEISYIHSESYYSGELKHGPIALIENGTLVIGILTVDELLEKSISNIQEVVSRGASTLIITDKDLKINFTDVIKVPETHKFLKPILSIIPLQLFAYFISKNKNLDVDKPRNLAKSVTVE